MAEHVTAPLWERPEQVDIDALEQAWGSRKLGLVMAAALASFNRLGHVNAGTAADYFGVSAGTIRRWIRDGVPASRLRDLVSLVRPPQGAFDQEQKDLVHARNAISKISNEPDNAAALWGYKGWLEKHDLAVIKIKGMPVHTVRLARTDRDRDGDRRLRAGGEIVAIATFPNMFAATNARGELLEDVYAYRVLLRNTKLASGAGKAWLAEAPHKPLTSYRKKPRKTVRPITRADV